MDELELNHDDDDLNLNIERMSSSQSTSGGGPGASLAAQIPANAPTTVLSRTALVTLAGAAYGASYGVLKHQQPGAFAFRTSLNCFTFAFPFFALREYAIVPVVGVFQGRFRSKSPEASSHTVSLRTHNLLPSAIAGAVVGGGLSTWAHGPSSLPRGMSTFGIICLGLQYVGNELDIARIKVIARYASKATDPPQLPVPSTAKSDAVSSDGDLRFQQHASAVPNTVSGPATDSSSSSSGEQSSVMSYLSSISPVRKVSDEEYAARLAAQKQQAEDRITALQRETKELEAELGQVVETTSATTATTT
ncbi:hypothetical protein A4X09_0g4408 [Tilletia walkeri]|uniref:Uncharacterized protein n=1 Tax=Tilletia walkeri TaxID=117179 RepID=A0A8X7N7W6_9BASI|nr:hypothetical protein A4X09_0g4408 [Tilletia walkeri]